MNYLSYYCVIPDTWVGTPHLLIELRDALVLEYELLSRRLHHLVECHQLGLQLADLIMFGGDLAGQRFHAFVDLK